MNKTRLTIALVALGVLPAGTVVHASGVHSAPRAQLVRSVSGCGSLQRGTHVGQMVIDHLHRTYLVHVPAHLPSGHPYPLVLMFHGEGDTATGAVGYTGMSQIMERYSEMSTLADKHGFIALYPSAWNPSPDSLLGTWNTSPNFTVDFDFVTALIRQLSPGLCVDQHRIYAAGFSDGGTMAFALACHVPGTFAAIGTVAASYPELLARGCHPRRWASVIAFHGTDDAPVPYTDSDSSPVVTKHWAKNAGCTTGPDTMWKRKDVTGQHYTHCRGATEVQLYSIHGGGHTWPGQRTAPLPAAGRVTHTIQASQTMWKFFQAHSIT